MEYHIMGANGMAGIKREVEKRSTEGWELAFCYQETSGGFFLFGGRRHILVFRRPK